MLKCLLVSSVNIVPSHFGIKFTLLIHTTNRMSEEAISLVTACWIDETTQNHFYFIVIFNLENKKFSRR
jgi:hypothetical protein